jgi:hypothetical protein
MGVTILPWAYRNYALFHRLVPTSTIGWMAMREGNTFGDHWRDADPSALRAFRRSYFAIPDEMERMDTARSESLALIRAEQPTWILKKLALNLPLLYGPDSMLLEKIRKGAYGEPSRFVARGLMLASAFFYSAVLAGGWLGILSSPRRADRLLPVFLLGIVTLVHLLANASPRYRVPLMPIFIVFASSALLRARSVFAALSPRRAAIFATFALLYLGVCVPRFLPAAARIWSASGQSESRSE